jgi:hypothetical protein
MVILRLNGLDKLKKFNYLICIGTLNQLNYCVNWQDITKRHKMLLIILKYQSLNNETN